MSLATGVGLASGINIDDLISKIQAVNQRPITNLASRQTQNQVKIAGFQAINAKLLDLNTAIAALRNESAFNSTNASSSDTTSLTVSADSTAAAGSYSINVLQIAQAERRAAQGVGSNDTIIANGGGGTLSFKVGSGAATTITVGASMTLEQLRTAINNASNSGVTASIIDDGAASNSKRLVLTVNNMGAANTLNILTNDTTLKFDKNFDAAQAAQGAVFDGTATAGGTYTGTGAKNYTVKITDAGDGSIGSAKFKVSTDSGQTWGGELTTSDSPVAIGDGLTMAFAAGTSGFALNDSFTIAAKDPILKQAQDAKIEVNGIQIQRSTNTFTGVADGVTFTAIKPTTQSVTADVSVNNQSSVSAINAFATAYNGVLNIINIYASYNADAKTAGPLFSDSTVAGIRRQLADAVSAMIPGTENRAYSSLASIGVSLSRTGELQVDNKILAAALDSHFEDVKSLFATIGSTDNLNVRLYSASGAKSAGGTYNISVLTPARQANINGAETIDSVSGLSSDETLTFTVNDTNYSVNLLAGDKLADVISKINAKAGSSAIDVVAYDNGGKLGLRTEAYGSAASLNVVSDKEGAGSTGIGALAQTSTGADVAGMINGEYASGIGRILTGGALTKSEGMQFEILTTQTGFAGSIHVSGGLSASLSQALSAITNTADGLIKTRTDGLTSDNKLLNDHISSMQDRVTAESTRLRAQFNAMESQLAQLQSIGASLTASLNQIAAMTTSL
ncbi:MAG: flagellar filament capping protein FliD [Candidatus Sumerlaeota bacterium]|nr:flagellar filament capping protein FliD [Candidatus Sumerlaeota bacterium]